jgi:hypothetical protein
MGAEVDVSSHDAQTVIWLRHCLLAFSVGVQDDILVAEEERQVLLAHKAADAAQGRDGGPSRCWGVARKRVAKDAYADHWWQLLEALELEIPVGFPK